MKVRNLGRKSLEEVINKLAEMDCRSEAVTNKIFTK